MTSAVRRDRPGRVIRVGDVQGDPVGIVAQAHRAGTLERIGIGTENGNTGQVIVTLQSGWIPGHHDILATLDKGVGGEGEINITRYPEPADLLEERVRVVDLNKLEGAPTVVGRWKWFIHDFRNDKRRFPAGGTRRFKRQHERAKSSARSRTALSKLR